MFRKRRTTTPSYKHIPAPIIQRLHAPLALRLQRLWVAELMQELDSGMVLRKVEADVHTAAAVLCAVLRGGEGVVVEKGEFVFVAGHEARVVLPGKGEERVAGLARVASVELGELVLFAAEGPHDFACLAVNEVDGVHVAGGDEVVSITGLWNCQ